LRTAQALANGALVQAWHFLVVVAFFCQNTVLYAKMGLVFFVLLFQLEELVS
jgi:hypothetical protein